MRLVMPAWFIRLPAMMKNGTASSGKLSMPLIIRWTTTNGGRSPVSRMYTRAEPAMAMATGTPAAMNPRNEPSRAGVMACPPLQLPTSSAAASYLTVQRGFGSLEHAEALPPVDDEDLNGPCAGTREPEHADRVHGIHRQLDDRHLVVAHLLHHRPRQIDRVTEEDDAYHIDERRQDAANGRRQEAI